MLRLGSLTKPLANDFTAIGVTKVSPVEAAAKAAGVTPTEEETTGMTGNLLK